MKKDCRRALQLLVWLAGLFLCPVSQGQEVEIVQRAYPVPDHGELTLDVPAHWEVTYVSLGDEKPPLITFFSREDDREIFQLNISILWDDGFKRDITSPEHIRSLVEASGMELLQQSRESELDLQPFEGAEGSGYYFRLSDNAPRAGEYPYLNQGALSVGNVVIIFSLFTHEQDSIEVQQSLKMLKFARQRFQPHV